MSKGMLSAALFLIATLVALPCSRAVSTTFSELELPNAPKDSLYWSKQWRDSVNDYQRRLDSYNNEVLSYDNAYMFSFFPFAAEALVTKHLGKASVFFFARTISAFAAIEGTLGFVRGQGSTLQNIVFVIAGVVGYFFFKASEISDVQHDVSLTNERLVTDWNIAESDIDSSSIRYPTKHWPKWVTDAPPARIPQSAFPILNGVDHAPTAAFELHYSVPF